MSIKFPLNGSVVNYDWDTVEYTIFRKKYEALCNSTREILLGKIDLKERSDLYGTHLSKEAYNLLFSIYSEFSIDFLKKGVFDFSEDKLKHDAEFSVLINPILEATKDLEETLQAIREYQEGEEERRDYRKETRDRVVGGGFGVGGFVKGALTAGTINMTTGLAHIAFNAIGNMYTAIEAKKYRNEAFDKFDTNIVKAYDDSIDTLRKILIRQLNIKANIDYNGCNTIINNISNGTITEELKRNALVQAIQFYPYEMNLYSIYLELYPIEETNICNIAEHFGFDANLLHEQVHNFDGIYFDSPSDKKAVAVFVLGLTGRLKEQFGEDAEKAWYDKNILTDTLNFKLIDEYLSSFDYVLPSSTVVENYFNEKKQHFVVVRNEMEEIKHDNELHIVPSYEAAAYLAKSIKSAPYGISNGLDIDHMVLQKAMNSYAKSVVEPSEVLFIYDGGSKRNPYMGFLITFDKFVADDNGSQYSESLSNIASIDVKPQNRSVFLRLKNGQSKDITVDYNDYWGIDQSNTVNNYMTCILKPKNLSKDAIEQIYQYHKTIDRIPKLKTVKANYLEDSRAAFCEKEDALVQIDKQLESKLEYRKELLEKCTFKELINSIISQEHTKRVSNFYVAPNDIPAEKLNKSLEYLENRGVKRSDIWLIYENEHTFSKDEWYCFTYNGVFNRAGDYYDFLDIKELLVNNSGLCIITLDDKMNVFHEVPEYLWHRLDSLLFNIFHPYYMEDKYFTKLEEKYGDTIKSVQPSIKYIPLFKKNESLIFMKRDESERQEEQRLAEKERKEWQELLSTCTPFDVVNAIFDKIKNPKGNNLYALHSEGWSEKLNEASKYLNQFGVDQKQVWFIYAAELFGGAKKGFSLTRDGIYSSKGYYCKFNGMKNILVGNKNVSVLKNNGESVVIYDVDDESTTHCLQQMFVEIFHPENLSEYLRPHLAKYLKNKPVVNEEIVINTKAKPMTDNQTVANNNKSGGFFAGFLSKRIPGNMGNLTEQKSKIASIKSSIFDKISSSKKETINFEGNVANRIKALKKFKVEPDFGDCYVGNSVSGNGLGIAIAATDSYLLEYVNDPEDIWFLYNGGDLGKKGIAITKSYILNYKKQGLHINQVKSIQITIEGYFWVVTKDNKQYCLYGKTEPGIILEEQKRMTINKIFATIFYDKPASLTLSE